MSINSTRRTLSETFQTTILHWARADELQLVLAGACQAPEGVLVTSCAQALPQPSRSQRFSLGNTSWPQLALRASPYPLLLFILDGEADIRIGVTARMTKAKDARKAGIYVYALPTRSCLFIPPHTPFHDGSTPHWEREHLESARSQILWLRILPTGALFHICSTAGAKHAHTSTLLVHETQLSALAQFMLEKFTTAPQNDALLRSYLTTLLLCLDRTWTTGHISLANGKTDFATPFEHKPFEAQSDDAQSAVFERACQYIQSHLVDALSPAQIAHQAYVSESQLKRMFRAQLQMSVMQYVAQRRLEEAKVMLLATDLTIEAIGVNCGYPQRTHFSRAFKAHAGASPQQFRRNADRHKA